jgi:multiple sugar transport system ATP-binding protein
MARVRLEQVEKVYPNGHVAARGLDFEIADGEFMVLVGPSGCGKSTALRMIAGLETPTRGRVLIGDRDVTSLPPQERDIAMVFQSYALYPHMTVRENLGFGLRMRGAPKEEIGERVVRAAQALSLDQVLERRPSQLSGGQRQRVALGRAIVRDPQVFLFDEPLSNLDAKLRVETRAELARLHRRLRATIVYVTHDQEEALTLGNRIAVMHGGVVEQVAPPMEVYRRPATAFVAGFVGSPAMNLLGGEERSDGRWYGPGGLVLSRQTPGANAGGGSVTLGVRPHEIEIVGAGAGAVDARVDVVEPRGSELLVYVRLGTGDDAPEVRIVAPPETAVVEDATVGLRLDPARLHWFDGQTGRRLPQLV